MQTFVQTSSPSFFGAWSAGGVRNVILTAAGDYTFAGAAQPDERPQEHLGIITVGTALVTAGFPRDRLSVLCVEGQRPALDADAQGLVRRLADRGAGEEGSVVGISAATDEYAQFTALSGLIRRHFPAARIVAGGPHFVRTREGMADPVERALRKGHADAVQVGHAGAFVDLVARCDGDIDAVTAPGLYRIDPASGRVYGRGRGRFPQVAELPFTYDPVQRRLGLSLAEGCEHGCDFCSVAGRPRPLFDSDFVIQGLRTALADDDVSVIVLHDSNPLHPALRAYYRDVFLSVPKAQSIPKFAYVDPAMLALDFMESLNTLSLGAFWYFYAGRDAVLAESAAAVGAKLRGSLKDQSVLDAEKSSLIEFITTMKTLRALFPDAPPMNLAISYIVSPFETRRSALATHDEMRELLAYSDESMGIEFAVHSLRPYPHTQVRKRYADAIDVEDFDFHRDERNRLSPWKAGAGPALGFHRAVAMIPAGIGAKAYIGRFREAIDAHLGR